MSTHIKNSDNGKSDILAKSRKLKQDEGIEYAERRGSKLGVIVYAIVASVIMIFSVPEQMDVVYTIASLSYAFVFGGTFSIYRFSKDRFYLISAIVSASSMIIFALMVILPAIS